MTSTLRLSRVANDDGAAMVEFAVVIGLLLYLILGAVSFGVLLATSHSMNEAVGESARSAALGWDDPDTTGVDERIAVALASLANNGFDCNPTGATSCEVVIAPCVGTPSNDCATVEIVLDRNKDSLVGHLPIIEAVLPDTLSADATAMVNG